MLTFVFVLSRKSSQSDCWRQLLKWRRWWMKKRRKLKSNADKIDYLHFLSLWLIWLMVFFLKLQVDPVSKNQISIQNFTKKLKNEKKQNGGKTIFLTMSRTDSFFTGNNFGTRIIDNGIMPRNSIFSGEIIFFSSAHF